MELAQLTAFAQQVAAGDGSGHGFDHITRVVATARRLCDLTPGVDRAVVMAAATLHDTYDDKLVASVPAARARTQAALAAAGADAATQTEILTIIDHMGFTANLAHHQPLSLAGQLVQDADRLDALGAIGIARAFQYGGAHATALYDPAISPRQTLTAATYREATTTLNHFEEKLFHLADQMNTAAGRQLATAREQVMREFVAEFKAEWAGLR